MIRAVIIDDEKNNIENLDGLLQRHCSNVSVEATATGADQGAEIILQYRPDLVFLDIQMPGKNGFEMLKGFSQHNFELIFVTAFDKYGIQAIKFSAIDYLLKPVNIEELKIAVGKAVTNSESRRKNGQLENLIKLLQHKQYKNEHQLALPTAKEIRFVRTEQIVRCESSNIYTSFYLADGQKIMVSRPISEYEELLKDYGFIRCHQSHLVNKAMIKSWVKKDGGYLLLEDGSQITVSRSRKDVIVDIFLSSKK